MVRKGKKCGNSWIPADAECRVGEAEMRSPDGGRGSKLFVPGAFAAGAAIGAGIGLRSMKRAHTWSPGNRGERSGTGSTSPSTEALLSGSDQRAIAGSAGQRSLLGVAPRGLLTGRTSENRAIVPSKAGKVAAPQKRGPMSDIKNFLNKWEVAEEGMGGTRVAKGLKSAVATGERLAEMERKAARRIRKKLSESESVQRGVKKVKGALERIVKRGDSLDEIVYLVVRGDELAGRFIDEEGNTFGFRVDAAGEVVCSLQGDLRSDAKKKVLVKDPRVKGGFYYRMQEVGEGEEVPQAKKTPLITFGTNDMKREERAARVVMGAALLGIGLYNLKRANAIGEQRRKNAEEWKKVESEFWENYRKYEQYAKQAKERQKERAAQPKWHDVLGVDEDASPDEVRKAYKNMARKFHPDVNKDPGAEDMMKKINEAYSRSRENRGDSGDRTLEGDYVDDYFRARLDSLGARSDVSDPFEYWKGYCGADPDVVPSDVILQTTR